MQTPFSLNCACSVTGSYRAAFCIRSDTGLYPGVYYLSRNPLEICIFDGFLKGYVEVQNTQRKKTQKNVYYQLNGIWCQITTKDLTQLYRKHRISK